LKEHLPTTELSELRFDEESITYDDAGDAKFAYFKEEIGGFKIHLVNN